jgi:hypothetical protein
MHTSHPTPASIDRRARSGGVRVGRPIPSREASACRIANLERETRARSSSLVPAIPRGRTVRTAVPCAALEWDNPAVELRVMR